MNAKEALGQSEKFHDEINLKNIDRASQIIDSKIERRSNSGHYYVTVTNPEYETNVSCVWDEPFCGGRIKLSKKEHLLLRQQLESLGYKYVTNEDDPNEDDPDPKNNPTVTISWDEGRADDWL